MEEKLNLFLGKQEKVKRGTEATISLNSTLSRIGDKYQRLVSGFGENAPDRDTLVELLTSWIVFWAKFPFEIGKRMVLA